MLTDRQTGELTGYPSIDKPWLKYYSGEAINALLPECTIYEYLWENNKDTLDKTALNYFGHKISYGQMFKLIERTAKGFSSLGVKEGDIVTVFSINTPETIICLFSLNLIGVIPSMEYVTESKKQAVESVKLTSSKTVVILDALLPQFSCVENLNCVEHVVVLPISGSMPLAKRVLSQLKLQKQKSSCGKAIAFYEMLGQGIHYHKAVYKKGFPAVIVHSGGTTGIPKGVVLSNDSLNYIAWIFKNNKNDARRGDTWLCAIPAFHAFGLAMGIIFPLNLGMQLILTVKYTDQELVRLFIKYKPNHIMGSGAHIPSIQASPKIQRMNLSFFKTCGLGGTPLTEEKEKELVTFLAERGSIAKASIGYGMSETSSAIATELNRYYGKTGSAGIILCQSNVKVIDVDSNKELPYGEIGELCFSGPGVMVEYYQNSHETDRVLFFDDAGVRWLHSGDLGYVDRDGFLFITGRIKRIYSTRSERNGTLFKLFPDYVAKVIEELPNIKQCVIVCIDDPDYKSIPIAFAVMKDYGNREIVKAAIVAHVSEVLPVYCVPKRIIFLDEIPMTPIGKIDYRVLEEAARK